MPQCKICSKSATTGVVLHSECYEKMEKLMVANLESIGYTKVVRCSECAFHGQQGGCLYNDGLKNTNDPNGFCYFGTTNKV